MIPTRTRFGRAPLAPAAVSPSPHAHTLKTAAPFYRRLGRMLRASTLMVVLASLVAAWLLIPAVVATAGVVAGTVAKIV